MRVLHIVAGNLNGGAARGAYWLHKALLNEGIESRILNNSRIEYNSDPSVETIIKGRQGYLSPLRAELAKLVVKVYKNKKKGLFSHSLLGYDFTKHPLYEWADVINLHWINIGFVNIKHLRKIKKPIVWTMRDMWPMTGGCHYSFDCDRYKTGCGKCPLINSNRKNDLSRLVLKRKLRYLPKHMQIVGISNWITNKARESLVFKDFNVFTIYNNVNCETFYPVDKSIARKLLGIKTNKKIILAGAQKLTDDYKGFDLLLKTLNKLEKEHYFLVIFGKLEKQALNSIPLEYMNIGYLRDGLSLRIVYSAADVFIAPSKMEAFGKTLVESMACATPVVCFDATGPKEIVDHKVNGYKANPFDTADLKNGIEWVVENTNILSLGEMARNKVLNEFDSKLIAKKYAELYNSLING